MFRILYLMRQNWAKRRDCWTEFKEGTRRRQMAESGVEPISEADARRHASSILAKGNIVRGNFERGNPQSG